MNTPLSSIKCHKCGKGVGFSRWMDRINPKGEKGIWECRPNCEAILTNEDAIMGAINSTDSKDKTNERT